MINLKQLASAVSQLAEEKGIPRDKIIETIEMAIAAAYKKDNDMKNAFVKVNFDEDTGRAEIFKVKKVISKEEKKELEEEGHFNPEAQILLKDAKKEKKNIKEGEEIKYPLQADKSYGRIASQTAKQVIIQKIREYEKEAILSEYKDQLGKVVSGVVQRVERNVVYFDIGKATGAMLPQDQVISERYVPGERYSLYLMKVEETERGAQILVSRSSGNLVQAMLEEEVPEIRDGIVEVKSIAREAGSRTKIAVKTDDDEIDPIGACIGQRGGRIQVVIDELAGEKIDVLEWREDPERFIETALSPAKVEKVEIVDNQNKEAKVFVNEDQLSLAIGKKGQNVRLAVKLTGWKIDVVKNEEQEATKEKPEKENNND